MQRILWDVMKADALARNFSYRDSSKNDTLENAARQRIIFEHYKVSKKEYYKSFAYYNSKPDLFQVLLDSALVKGKRRDSVTYALPTAIP